MLIHHRADLTAADLKQWRQEAEREQVLATASSGAGLLAALELAESLRPDGSVAGVGCRGLRWRQTDRGQFVAYYPATSPGDTGNMCRVIRGPWA